MIGWNTRTTAILQTFGIQISPWVKIDNIHIDVIYPRDIYIYNPKADKKLLPYTARL